MQPTTRKPSFFQTRGFKRFRANKLSFYAAVIFLLLFGVSLFADVLANDRPVVVYYKHHVYFPVFQSLPETTFGGVLRGETDYSLMSIRSEINNNGFYIMPPIHYRYDSIITDLKQPSPTPPDRRHWLGTDSSAGDVLAELLYGFRISVLFGFMLTIASTIIGVIAGGAMGFFGGKIDLLGQRFMEIWGAIPMLFLLIILSSLIVPNFWWLFFLLLLFGWMQLTHLVRAEVLRVRQQDYIKAARVMGLSSWRIITHHVLPNALTSVVTFLPFLLAGSVTTLTSLDFLGFGLPPGSPSLGYLLKEGKDNINALWLSMTSFIVITTQLSLLTFIGAGLRDALDPRR
ncbi:MAG: ABC transporter permease [Hydrotalea sp.]|nr:ABC transporter permease [Hydrotalea sp.]